MKKKILFQKYFLYLLILLFSYVIQATPGLLSIGGNKPLLVLGAVVAIAIKEKELVGGIYGAVGGIFCDLSALTYFGLYSISFLLIGAAVGLMVTFLVRDKLSNAALLTLGGMLFVKLWEYFFAYGIWGYDPTGQIFWTRILPTVLYSTLWTPLWYWLFGRLSEYFARRLEVR